MHLISSIILVFSGVNNLPTLYFWGIHIINSVYMLAFGWIMVLVTPQLLTFSDHAAPTRRSALRLAASFPSYKPQ